MKYLGKSSVSSKIRGLLTVMWYGSLITGVFVLGLLALGAADVQWLSQLQGDVSIEAAGLKIKFGGIGDGLGFGLLLRGLTYLALPALALFLFALSQLRRIFGTLVDENPFVMENVQGIRRIGATLIVWAFYEGIGYFIVGLFIMQNVSLPGVEIDAVWKLNPSMLVVGLMVLVLAEVFHVGVRLREEQELTI